MVKRRKLSWFSKLTSLFLILFSLGNFYCCCFTKSRLRGTRITLEEAKEEMVFALYLPAYLPVCVDPSPKAFRIPNDSLPPNVEIYYVKKDQRSERLLMIFATRAGSSSRASHASERQLITLPNGNLAVNRSMVFDEKSVREADLVKGPPYQTSLWWDLGSGEQKAWYTIYSTFSLSETLKIVNSMEPVP